MEPGLSTVLAFEGAPPVGASQVVYTGDGTVTSHSAVTLVKVCNGSDGAPSTTSGYQDRSVTQITQVATQPGSTAHTRTLSTTQTSTCVIQQATCLDLSDFGLQSVNQFTKSVNQKTEQSIVNPTTVLDGLGSVRSSYSRSGNTREQVGGYSLQTLPGSDHLLNSRSSVILEPKFTVETENKLHPIIKSSLKKTSQDGVRKSVKFCASDLVHVEEYAPPPELFLVCGREFDEISDGHGGSVLHDDFWDIGGESADPGGHGFWFESSTDTDPHVTDPPRPTSARYCPPLSFSNDVFGRTTIFVTSGNFRPGDYGKLNGKSASDVGGSQDKRRTLSAGTLSSIRSNRTLVKVDFVQGLFDLNHNPGQTDEVDSKSVLDTGSDVSSCKYGRAETFHASTQGTSVIEFPCREKEVTGVDKKICHKMSHYKYKLVVLAVGAVVLTCIAVALVIGLRE